MLFKLGRLCPSPSGRRAPPKEHQLTRQRLRRFRIAGAAMSAGAVAPGWADDGALEVTARPISAALIEIGAFETPASRTERPAAASSPVIIKTVDAHAAAEFAPLSDAALATALLAEGLRGADTSIAESSQLLTTRTDPEGSSTQEQVLFEADEITRDDEASPLVARGNVRAYSAGRYLEADMLSYDPATDVVVAEGRVSITDEGANGPQTVFAGRVELTGDLRDGVAQQFSALMEEGARLAAQRGVRDQGAQTRLSRAVFSACAVCKESGEGKTPTWRIRALRVTRDEERKVVRFRHAFFEIKGVPILYAPFLQTADPSVERQSGFLTPVVGTSGRLGFNAEIPYYLAFSNHTDATFYPKYTSRDGVLWQGEWRQRGRRGGHVWQAGVIDFDPTEPDQDGNLPIDVPGVRWHYFGRGSRTIGEQWRIGYDIERVSDDTYFRRYDVERRGDLRRELDTVQTNRLRSNVNVRWRSGGSELRADSYLFQGLRATDRSELTPFVLPAINFRHDFDQKVIGGDLQANANIAILQRTSGADSRRLTADVNWRRDFVTDGGHRFNIFGEVRGDYYRFADLDEGTEILAADPTTDNRAEARFLPTLAAEWTYPLTKRAGSARLIVEPRIQAVISASDRNPSTIINEDSQSVEFDFPGLFEYNKSPGFDSYEDGQRLNAGLTTSAIFDSGVAIDASVGAQFRAQSTDAFNLASGLGERRSDIVGALNLRYKHHLIVENRFRIDDDTGAIPRLESTATTNVGRFTGAVSYVRLNEENPAADLVQREELNANARIRVTKRWSMGGGWRQDLFANRTISQDIAIGYADECATFDVVYRRDLTRDVNLPADNAILLRFTLRSLVN